MFSFKVNHVDYRGTNEAIFFRCLTLAIENNLK